MQPHYDWQKGQAAWEAIEPSGQTQGEQVKDLTLQRRWQVGLAVVLIISLIGGSVFWFLNRRAKTNSAAVEDDILRTNSLIFQAVMSGDVELLRSNLSGRSPSWANLMSTLVSSGLVYDRDLWGLDFQPSAPDDSQIRIVLNPEWNSAELIVPLDFVYETAAGPTQTVQLEQTLVYRRNQERWLLAPADISFWGERELFEGQYLTLAYPTRDKDIVERLGGDLDRLVGRICDEVEEAVCSADFQLMIDLYEDTPDIAVINSASRMLPCAEKGFELPTPTLVGLPVDAAGYEALIGGYRSEVAAITLANIYYPANCDYSRLKIVLLDYRLSKMDFQRWSMMPDDYVKLWQNQFHLEQMFYALQRDGQTVWNHLDEMSYYTAQRDGSVGNDDSGAGSLRPYYALITFLTEVYGTPLTEIEAYIDRERLDRTFYWSTLHNWTDQNFAADGPLEEAWGVFLAEKAGIDESDGPELPEQNLRMVCYGGDITTGIAYPNGVLYELDVTTGQLTAVFPLNHTDAYIVSLPEDDGVIVAERRLDFVTTNGRVFLWKDGDPVVLFETADNVMLAPIFDFRAGEERFLGYDRQNLQYSGYGLGECGSGAACDGLVYGGFPVLSPSEERFLSLLAMGNPGYEGRFFRPFTMSQLTTFSDSLMGKSPFWLSDERIGYIVENGRAVTGLTVAGEDYSEQRQVLFTLAEVDPLLALDEEATIESVLSNPNEPQDLLVTVVDGDGWASIYQVNILRRWIQKLVDREFLLNEEVVYSFDFSPEARWLVISGNDLTTSTAYLHFYDLDVNEVHSYSYKMLFNRPMHWTMDWSAGDEWLALPDNGYIRLINPTADYQEVVVPEGVGCSGAVWVDGE